MSIFLGSPPSSLVYGFLSFITTKAHATLRFTITLLASKGQIIYLSQAQKSYFNIYTTWLFRNKIWLVILIFFLDVTNNDVMYRKFSSGHGTNITHITPCWKFNFTLQAISHTLIRDISIPFSTTVPKEKALQIFPWNVKSLAGARNKFSGFSMDFHRENCFMFKTFGKGYMKGSNGWAIFHDHKSGKREKVT